MRFYKRQARWVLAATVLLTSTTSLAQGEWYGGISLGFGEANKLEFSDIDDGSALSGSFDDRDFAWKVFGGYAYNEFVAIEAAYQDLGEVTLDAESDGSGSIFAPGPVVAKTDASGFSLAVVASMPVSERLHLFVRAGYFAWESRTSLSNESIGTPSIKEEGSDPTFGIGAAIELNDRWSLRGEYEKFTDIDDRDGSLLSLGLSVGFP